MRGISTVVLLVGLGLAALWIVSLMSVGTATSWFSWLVFVAAAILILTGIIGVGRRP